MIKRFSRNTQGCDWVVGDIHGCFLKLHGHLQAMGFNPEQGDRLFSVGDLIDRGPESEHALAWLQQPWFFAVRGNHEVMACDFYRGAIGEAGYERNGGAWFIGLSDAEQYQFFEAFTRLPVAMEIETEHGLVGIVHAECPFPSWQEFVTELQRPDFDFSKIEYRATWSRELIEKAAAPNAHRQEIQQRGHIHGLHRLVVGHVPLEKPFKLGSIHYIDTSAVYGKAFTVLNLGNLV